MVDMRDDMRDDSSLPNESREAASVLEPCEVVEAAERQRAGSGFAPMAFDGAASGECGRFSISADIVWTKQDEAGRGRVDREEAQRRTAAIFRGSIQAQGPVWPQSLV